jgi:L-fuconolactonase
VTAPCEIVDAHAHFWDPAARHHEWLAHEPSLQRRFGPEDIDAGRHTLAGIVFVQADCRADEAFDEVAWVARLAEEHERVRGIVAFAPVERGSAVEAHLARLAEEPRVVGVRRLLQGEPPSLITDPLLADGVRRLSAHDLPFDVCVTHDQLPAVAGLVRACPETSFVLDHLGKPPVASGHLDPWRENLAQLAALPNVVCKLSGLTTEAAPGEWRAADLRPYLDHALDVFGPGRCLIASDWPVLTRETTAEAWFDTVLEALAGCSADERGAVLTGSAERTYSLTEVPIPTRGDTRARGDLRR